VTVKLETLILWVAVKLRQGLTKRRNSIKIAFLIQLLPHSMDHIDLCTDPGDRRESEETGISWFGAIRRFFSRRALNTIGISLALHGSAGLVPIVMAGQSTTQEESAEVRITGLQKKYEQEVSVINDKGKIVEILHEKEGKAIEETMKERASRIDPVKTEALKTETRQKLLEGQKVRFNDFFRRYEQFAMGIDPEIIRKGEEFFRSQISELTSQKGKIPEQELLRKLAGLIDDREVDYSGINDNETSVFTYLASQADAAQGAETTLNGNCNARHKKILMALEAIFPEQFENVSAQALAGHLRVVFASKNGRFAIESGELVQLTDENLAGTILVKPQSLLRNFAGLAVPDARVEPGDYSHREIPPKRVVEDGLSYRLPENVKLRTDTDDPSAFYVNFEKEVKERMEVATKIGNELVGEKARQGISQVEFIEHFVDYGKPGYEKLTRAIEEWFIRLAKAGKKNGEAAATNSKNEILSFDLINRLTTRQWGSRFSIVINSLFSVYSSKEITALFSKGTHTRIQLGYLDSIPSLLTDNMPECTNRVPGVNLIFNSDASIDPVQLRKLLLCNGDLQKEKPSHRFIGLGHLKLDAQLATVIAEENKGSVNLQPDELVYSDEIMRILATTKAPLKFYLASRNQLEKYKRQSPWLFQAKYNIDFVL
jgi:hypothetical protein